ncbi:MAG TPA: hypothetical protein VGL77_05310 [Armatimonadota bacterium]|jgi:hypothetical protein
MRFTIYLLGVCLLMLSSVLPGVGAPAETFRGGTGSWCGDPDAVQPADNPYVKQANSLVARAMQHPDVFWYTWGYAAPESTRKGDAKLLELTIKEMDVAVGKLVEKPSGFWDILTVLECVRMLQRVPDFPADKLTTWLAQLRPSVQSNYDLNTKGDEWMSTAPNTLHQSAAILQLGSIMYKEPRYAELAKTLVRTAGKYQEADGAFRYILNSGPSQIYYGFDSTYLGRYYQLSRDPLAKEQLIKMAGFSKDALANGMLDGGATAPWWKHHWGTGGPIHGVEIIAGLSRDPLSRAVADLRITSGGQPYFFSYYAMYFWDGTIAKAPLGADLCRYNTNYAGPQIRKGAWQVVMPGKGYGDSGLGCTVVSGAKPFAYDGYLESVALPVLMKGVSDAYARPGSLMAIPPEETTTRATLVGADWIAAGWTYQPRSFFFGDPQSPPAKGWRVAQLWYADGTGVGGWITVTASADSPVIAGPRGYVAVGPTAPVLDPAAPTRVTAGKLVVQAWGDGVKTVTPVSQKNSQFVWIDLDKTGERAYTAGEQFGYGLSATSAGNSPYTVSRPTLSGTVVATQIVRTDGKTVTVLFNPSDAAQTVTPPVKTGALWRAAGDKTSHTPWNGKPLSLQAYELVVILP